MSDLALNQSVNLNIIFMITAVVGFIYNDNSGRNAMLVTVVLLLLSLPTLYIIKEKMSV